MGMLLPLVVMDVMSDGDYQWLLKDIDYSREIKRHLFKKSKYIVIRSSYSGPEMGQGGQEIKYEVRKIDYKNQSMTHKQLWELYNKIGFLIND